MLSIQCNPQTDPHLLLRVLKCADQVAWTGLAKHVWQWSEPIWKCQLDDWENGSPFRLVFGQSAESCAKHGRTDHVNQVWCERFSQLLGWVEKQFVTILFHSAINNIKWVPCSRCAQKTWFWVLNVTRKWKLKFWDVLKWGEQWTEIKLIERIWKWSEPRKKFQLEGGGDQNSTIALPDTQYIAWCRKLGLTDQIMKVWNEWCGSIVFFLGVTKLSSWCAS